jgi:ATP-dependent phosphofructokinase / diphosphate-dependent phosphofructokinase
MDFEHSARTEELLKRLAVFQEQEILPREEPYHRELLARTDPWVVLPVIEELKMKAKQEGLWNLFLPDEQHGAGLSNVEYAPLAERMGRSLITAESHNRVIVVEVMGRHAGWIATHAGIAAGADAILVPERPFDIDDVCASLRRRHERGRSFSIVVVAEGATPREGTIQTRGEDVLDAFGHARLGGIGVTLEREIEARTGYETRVTILGHVQRGGTPVAFDRVLATRFGVAAMDAVAAGRFGTMVSLRSTEIVEVKLEEALREPKLLDPALYETAELFFG